MAPIDDASASVPAAPCETAAAAAPSKRSLKRAARFAEKDAKKKAKKAARAEDVATRANAGREAAAARLAAMSDEDRTKHFALIEEKKVERALEKAASDAAFGARCAAGCRIAIDCEFDDLMTEREASSSCQQIMYCYGALKRAEQPSRLLLTGLKGRQAGNMAKIGGFDKWLATTVETKTLAELFPTPEDRSELVYLTADSETVLTAPDPKKTYVIGGFVDRNRHKGLTRAKADELGVATASLPIGSDMPIVLDNASRVLAINHVFELVVRVQSSKDWADAATCLPGRKLAAAEEDEGEKPAAEAGEKAAAPAADEPTDVAAPDARPAGGSEP